MKDDPVTIERDAIIAHMRCAIARGYSQKTAGQCEHGKFYFEDCIGCYDEYLDGELSAILNGAHLTKDTPNTFDISRQEARMAAVGLKDSDNA